MSQLLDHTPTPPKNTETENQYHMIFENSLDAILVADSTGKIVAANPEACRLFKYSEEEMIHKEISSLINPDDSSLEMFISERKKNGYVRGKLMMLDRNEHIFHTEITSNLFIDLDGVEKCVMNIRDVTERVDHILLLNEVTRQLNTVISNLPGMVYRCLFDFDWPMLYISDGCSQLTGYSASDFIEPGNIFFTNLILDEYKDFVFEKWEEAIASHDIFEEEYQIKDADGNIKWVWERGRGVFDDQNELLYLEGYIEDITFRKINENEIKKLSQAVAQNLSPIAVTDIEGNIEYVNDSFCTSSGYSRDEVIGQNMRILKSGETPIETYKIMWKTILDKRTWQGELKNRNKKGETYWENKAISPILDSKGTITNFVSVAENINERKIAEKELIKAIDRALESDRLKSAFLENMSHELRTPLNAVIGFSELIDDDMPTEQIIEFSKIINRSGNQLLEIVEQIFDITLLQTGGMYLEKKPYAVNTLISEIEEVANKEKERLNKTHLTFDCLIDDRLKEYTLFTDPKRLKQILVNLIKNAIKFTSIGYVRYGLLVRDDELLFWVKDSGIGISLEQQEHIFEMFRHAEESATKRYEGSGIGLTIARKLAELLGGTMWVESEVNKGSKFYFTIPLD